MELTSHNLKVWSRVSFSDDMTSETQIWGDQYVLGSYTEKIVELKQDSPTQFSLTLEISDKKPVTQSFINNYEIGSRRQCVLFMDKNAKIPHFARTCSADLSAELENDQSLPNFYKMASDAVPSENGLKP